MKLNAFQVLLVAATGSLSSQVYASTYYINNAASSGCSDSGAGTSSVQPWCTFTPLVNRTLAAGDTVLLNRSSVWNQELKLNGSGSPSSPITVGAYGTGARPKIARSGNAQDRGIRMTNPSYITIQDLEISNAGSGIYVFYTAVGNAGLTFNHLFLHDIHGIHNDQSNSDKIFNSAGINITGSVAVSQSTPTVLSDSSFNDIESSHSQAAIYLDWGNGSGLSFPQGYFVDADSFRRMTVKRLYTHDEDAAGETGATCPDILRMGLTSDSVVFSSTFDKAPECSAPAGIASVFLSGTRNDSFVNNRFLNVAHVDTFDETAIDNEALTDSMAFKGNLFAQNAGAGIEFLAIHPPSDLGGVTDYSINSTVLSNTFLDNGGTNTTGSNGALYRGGTKITPTGNISDNIYYQENAFLTPPNLFSGFSVSNNRLVQALASTSNAADGFSGTQGAGNWAYEHSTNGGSTWISLPSYNDDATDPNWSISPSSAYPRVSRSEQLPDAATGSRVSRKWTSPAAGTVSLRGWAIKSDPSCGDGVSLQINLNGTPIWGPKTISYSDQVGFSTNVDSVSVNSQDVIQFISSPGISGNNACDWISWAPSIAYLPPSPRIDDSETGPGTNQFHYVGPGWTHCNDGSCGSPSPAIYFGTQSYDNQTGDSVSLQYQGSGIALFGCRQNNAGILSISVDGGAAVSINAYAPSQQCNQPLFQASQSQGSHTLAVAVSGSRDAASADAYILVDRADVLAGTAVQIDDAVSGSGINQFEYVGSGWTHCSDGVCGSPPSPAVYAGTVSYSNSSGDYINVRFSGTAITVFGCRQNNAGIALATIDGKALASINAYAPAQQCNQPLIAQDNLPAGAHTLRLSVGTRKESSSQNTYLLVDRAEVR